MDTLTTNRINETAKVFKALSHPSRVYIIEELIKGERCICEFADLLSIDKSTVSKHFAILKEADIIDTNKIGTSVMCSLKMTCVVDFMKCGCKF